MPFEVVKKIIDEAADTAFPNPIKMIHLSENGEALYHPEFLEIVRYIKAKLPNTALNLLSNFGLMTPKIARALLEEKLLSSIQVNIDGHDAKSYKAVKGIAYAGVIKNGNTLLKANHRGIQFQDAIKVVGMPKLGGFCFFEQLHQCFALPLYG